MALKTETSNIPYTQMTMEMKTLYNRYIRSIIKKNTPNSCPYVSQIFTNSQNSSSDRFISKYAVKIVIKIHLHLKCTLHFCSKL